MIYDYKSLVGSSCSKVVKEDEKLQINVWEQALALAFVRSRHLSGILNDHPFINGKQNNMSHFQSDEYDKIQNVKMVSALSFVLF